MILFLNTAGFDKISFALIDSAKVLQKSVPIKNNESQKTLPALKQFLSQHKAVGKITKIIVASGPGSFSGLRVSVAQALAFSLAWQIPAYAIKNADLPKNLSAFSKPDLKLSKKIKKIAADFDPDYGMAPKITKEKPKNLRNT